jgi:hypothetical protein
MQIFACFVTAALTLTGENAHATQQMAAKPDASQTKPFYIYKSLSEEGPICTDILHMLNAPENRHFLTQESAELHEAKSRPETMDEDGIRIVDWREWKNPTRDALKSYYGYDFEGFYDWALSEGRRAGMPRPVAEMAILPFKAADSKKIPVKVLKLTTEESIRNGQWNLEFRPIFEGSMDQEVLEGFKPYLYNMRYCGFLEDGEHFYHCISHKEIKPIKSLIIYKSVPFEPEKGLVWSRKCYFETKYYNEEE